MLKESFWNVIANDMKLDAGETDRKPGNAVITSTEPVSADWRQQDTKPNAKPEAKTGKRKQPSGEMVRENQIFRT